MTFYVQTYREAPATTLDDVVARIRHWLAESPATRPTRRAARVFQRLHEPSHVLTLSEWNDEAAFWEFSASPEFRELDALTGQQPTIVPLVPLIRSEHMARRATVGSCVTIAVSAEADDELREFLVGRAHDVVKALPGLVSREVYRARDIPHTYLVVHSWTTLEHLERFRATHALRLDEVHDRLGTTVVAFTGGLTAQFSAFRPTVQG